MKTEIKTATITIILIAGVIIGVWAYFDLTSKNTTSTKFIVTSDKTNLKKVPKLDGITGYVNVDAVQFSDMLKGKVVLYDFWTYSCINCQRTLPYLTAWADKYADKGLVIVGIHSPEFEFEKDINNVKAAVKKFGINYPVVLDNEKKIWNSFENRYWPRKYIVDDEGYIRYDHIGEGKYDETEYVIQQLLNERTQRLGLGQIVDKNLVDIKEFEHQARTPEIYFGYEFAAGRNQFGNTEGFTPNNTVQYTIPPKIEQNKFYLQGSWENLKDSMLLVSENGIIILPYFAKQVNIVAAGNSELEIYIDDNLISQQNAGLDVNQDGKVITSEARLYNLVNLDEADYHTIKINVKKPGFQIYTFTFG